MFLPAQAQILTGIDWVAVLNTGATGFAVIMLYISYQLIARAQQFIFEKDPKDFPDLDVFRAWSELVRTMVRQTRSFMILAAIFFFGGLSVIIYQFQAESDIVLTVRPFDQPFPRVFVQSTESTFGETGHAELRVRSGQTVEVKADPIYERLDDLEDELSRVKASLHSTTVRAAEDSGEFGL